jgi:LacI family transcriptional regulator
MASPTLKDVAEHAGVSQATVSRVLNNNPSVAENLRERVLKAVRALGYQPNRAARRLRANTNDVLGLIISDIENPYFTSVVRGVEDAAYAEKMSVVLCNTDEKLEKQRMYLQVMQAEQVAGLIITPTHIDDSVEFAPLIQAGMPVVLLDRQTSNYKCDAVVVNNVGGAYEAVKHLIDLGYQRIGIVGGLPHLTTGKERNEGYLKALSEAGIETHQAYIKIGDFKSESGYRLTHELLETTPAPQAIFVANNLMTLGALRAIHERELHIPEDVALVGFDDMPWSGELCPPLTAVAQPTYDLGREAVRLLVRRLRTPHTSFNTVVLQTRLVIRESCGAKRQKGNCNCDDNKPDDASNCDIQ